MTFVSGSLQSPNEPSWDAPFGAGRPGWHIEDTAITESFFGSQYDIHGGAIDLIFPHHEAEIAQMEAASGKEPLVRIWMHGGFLNTGDQKMSKSLGNFTTIHDALTRYDYRTLRYLFLSSHYRSSLSFTEAALEQARVNVRRFDKFIFSIDNTRDDAELIEGIEALQQKVYAALDTDFNTPAALTAIHVYMKQQNINSTPGRRVGELFQALNGFFDFMKFNAMPTEADHDIDKLVAERGRYRSQKQFKQADHIRKELEDKGICLYDTEEGTKWRRI